MGFASVIHNGVQTSSKFDSLSLKAVSPVQLQPYKCIGVQFSHRHVPHFRTAVHNRIRAPFSSITCSRRTEQEGNSSTSEGKRTTSESSEEKDYISSSHTQGNQSHVSSVKTVALCVGTAVAFGIGLGFKDGVGKASEFFAGYILEQSLSVDNLFVFVLIFKYFKVPMEYQNRVLSYGIAGAVVFRLTLILLGAATLQRFEAVNLFLAAILLYSSFKLFASEDDDTDLSNNFVVKACQRFIPVAANYDGNRFITSQDGVWKVSKILGRQHLYFSP